MLFALTALLQGFGTMHTIIVLQCVCHVCSDNFSLNPRLDLNVIYGALGLLFVLRPRVVP